MNANELRIGNWIHNPVQGVDFKVCVIALSEINFEDGNKIKDDKYRFQPIPLTPEWLERFGFQSDNFTDEDRTPFMRIDDACGSFILDDEFILMDIDTRVQIKHVHQLQNLYFALTLQELTLNN
jgi:hypothetical protein